MVKSNNKYFILRHGEAISNKKEVISCWPEKFHNPLTLKGRRQVKDGIKKLISLLGDKKIDFIFSSDILRAKQSAEIAGKMLKVNLKYDKRLREYNVGVFNGKSIKYFRDFFPVGEKRIKNKPTKGETYIDIEKRVSNFLEEIEQKYSNKNILIVSHQVPLVFLEGKIKKISIQEILEKYLVKNGKKMKNGELRELT